MRADVTEVVERLRAARSLDWLRVIDDAALDRAVGPDEMADVVVRPYRWLLERVGNGLRLTQAGYLPPSVVTEAMAELGWRDGWYGKGNREDLTYPVLELRESAQRFGLLRKNRGQLLITKAGQGCLADPVALWWQLAERMPDAQAEPHRHAGLLYLLTVAAGRPLSQRLLAEGLAILGWVDRDTRGPVTPSAAFDGARDTWATLRRLGLLPDHRWNEPEPAPSDQAKAFARAALIGRAALELPPASPARPVHRSPGRAVQLYVRLAGIEPAIWRRIVVPASLTLRDLHAVLQTAMGWQDYHLHSFEVAGVRYGDVEDMPGWPAGDEEAVTVGQAAETVTVFEYEYDFGDGWEHEIRIEQVVASVGNPTPHLLGGERACPPEDCGGAGGYDELLEALADPANEEHQHLLEWVGGGYDPEAFDIEATNAALELIDRHTRRRRR